MLSAFTSTTAGTLAATLPACGAGSCIATTSASSRLAFTSASAVVRPVVCFRLHDFSFGGIATLS